MSDQDIAEFLSNRMDCLETRFETRFDRLEARLDRWMENNGKQNVSIQKNTDKIDGLCKKVDVRSKRILLISIGIAGCIATLLSAFIQVLVARIF